MAACPAALVALSRLRDRFCFPSLVLEKGTTDIIELLKLSSHIAPHVALVSLVRLGSIIVSCSLSTSPA
jgi:hypothetical protein